MSHSKVAENIGAAIAELVKVEQEETKEAIKGAIDAYFNVVERLRAERIARAEKQPLFERLEPEAEVKRIPDTLIAIRAGDSITIDAYEAGSPPVRMTLSTVHATALASRLRELLAH